MARVVRVGRPPYSRDVIAALEPLGPLFHPDPSQDGFRALGAAGLDVRALGEELPDDAILLAPTATGPLEELVQIADRLLAPDGCPWDREQTHSTLKRYLLEESYELFDAIDREDETAMLEELGDVLLQPVLHAAMAGRDGRFDVDAVAARINAKLIGRHPHVFGDAVATDTEAVLRQWDRLKATETAGQPRSVLAGVPRTMPALQFAYEVSKRAARAGFDWPDVAAVWAKVREEEAELDEAVASGDQARIEAEFGDLLFALVNVGRRLGVEPEGCLRAMVSRFIARFTTIERAAGRPLGELSAEQLDDLWRAAKLEEAEAR